MVRFGYGSGVKRFERLRFSVPAVPLQKRFFCVSAQFDRKGRFWFRFRFLENGSGGSVPLSVSGKTVPTVPVPGSGSVPESPCKQNVMLVAVFISRDGLSMVVAFRTKVHAELPGMDHLRSSLACDMSPSTCKDVRQLQKAG